MSIVRLADRDPPPLSRCVDEAAVLEMYLMPVSVIFLACAIFVVYVVTMHAVALNGMLVEAARERLSKSTKSTGSTKSPGHCIDCCLWLYSSAAEVVQDSLGEDEGGGGEEEEEEEEEGDEKDTTKKGVSIVPGMRLLCGTHR